MIAPSAVFGRPLTWIDIVLSSAPSVCCQNAPAFSSPDQFRQPEVQHLGQPLRRHHHVGRLQIAVHDARIVRGVQRIGHLHRVLQAVHHRQAPRLDKVRQRLAPDELHHDAFRVASNVMQRHNVVNDDDVWVVQRRGRARLLDESCPPVRRLSARPDQDFDGDKPPQRGVLRLVHRAHAAFPELFEDLVMRNGGSDHTPELSRCGTQRTGIFGLELQPHQSPGTAAPSR